MSGYMMILTSCCNCGKQFMGAPDLVPSIRLKDGKPDPNGKREGLCEECANRWCRLHDKDPAKVIRPGAYEPQEA